MIGYVETGGNFSVELYRGAWIMRAVLPTDVPAIGSKKAEAAIANWKESNLRKFKASLAPR